MEPQQTMREWSVGNDAYGRSVTLRNRRTYDGKSVWEVRTVPASQRDDGETISSLSLGNLQMIAAAIAKERAP